MKIRSDVTPSLHPAVIENIENYSIYEGYLRGAREAFELAYTELGAIHDARLSVAKNPTLNEAAKLLTVAEFASKRQDKITRSFDMAREHLISAANAAETALNEPMKAPAHSAISAEIRAHAKGLSDKNRSAFINHALASEDAQTLSAMLGAPGYLSGLKEVYRTAYTRRFHEQQNPELVKRLDATKRALSLIDTYTPLIWGEITKAVGASWDEVNHIKKAKDEAERAFQAV